MSLVVRDGFIVISYTDNKATFLQMAQDTWDPMSLPFNDTEFVDLLPLFSVTFCSLQLETFFFNLQVGLKIGEINLTSLL